MEIFVYIIVCSVIVSGVNYAFKTLFRSGNISGAVNQFPNSSSDLKEKPSSTALAITRSSADALSDDTACNNITAPL